jgi:hypothetical protein
MKAFGDNAVIIPVNNTVHGGIQIKGDGEGMVHSCPSHPEIEGKRILFNENIKYIEHEEYLIIRLDSILAILGDE